jgi:TM2 domain-containing membrane protein YozV
MKCAVHTDVDATGYCRNCGKPMCPECARPVRDVLYCEDCLATVMGHAAPPPVASAPADAPAASVYAPPPSVPLPMARPAGSSSPAVAFILGLFPGLGAIYNGQYNKGLIHIAIFASIIVALSTDLGGGLEPMLGIFLAGFIFYSAFEAMRTAQARNLGQVPADPLESWSKERPVGPIILIGLGVLLLLNNFHVLDFIRLGQFWPLILIGAGLYMFRNKIAGRS